MKCTICNENEVTIPLICDSCAKEGCVKCSQCGSTDGTERIIHGGMYYTICKTCGQIVDVSVMS